MEEIKIYFENCDCDDCRIARDGMQTNERPSPKPELVGLDVNEVAKTIRDNSKYVGKTAGLPDDYLVKPLFVSKAICAKFGTKPIVWPSQEEIDKIVLESCGDSCVEIAVMKAIDACRKAAGEAGYK